VVRTVAVTLLLLVFAAGCDSDKEPVRSRIIVSVSGRIGDLHIDESDRAAVVAFVGRPDAERSAREVPGRPYDALGYGCGTKRSEQTFPLLPYPAHRPPQCRTIFWIDVRSGKLEDFLTGDSRYSEAHGVRIGMHTAEAERLLHRRLTEGCEENIYLPSAKTFTLTIAFTGGTYQRRTMHVIGGHVFAFVLHSRRRYAGVFDCL
jgi:hypothetical protein